MNHRKARQLCERTRAEYRVATGKTDIEPRDLFAWLCARPGHPCTKWFGMDHLERGIREHTPEPLQRIETVEQKVRFRSPMIETVEHGSIRIVQQEH